VSYKVIEGALNFSDEHGMQCADVKPVFDKLVSQMCEQFHTPMPTVPPGGGAPQETRLPFAVVLTFQERIEQPVIDDIENKLTDLFKQLLPFAELIPGPTGTTAWVVDALTKFLSKTPNSKEAQAVEGLRLGKQADSAWPIVSGLLNKWTGGQFGALKLNSLNKTGWLDFLTTLGTKTTTVPPAPATVAGASPALAPTGGPAPTPTPASTAGAPSPGPAPGAATVTPSPTPAPSAPFLVSRLNGWLYSKQPPSGVAEYSFLIEGSTRYVNGAVSYGTWARLDVIGPDGRQLLTHYVDFDTLSKWLDGDGARDVEIPVAPTDELRGALATRPVVPEEMTTVKGRLWFSDGRTFGIRNVAVLAPPRVARLVDDACAPDDLLIEDCCDDGRALDALLTPQALAVTQTDQSGYFEFNYAGKTKLRARHALLQVSGVGVSLAVKLDKHSQADELGQFPSPVLLQIDSTLILDDDDVTRAASRSEDCGCRGIDFDEPNRALDEFRTQIIVRTTDPEIIRIRRRSPKDSIRGDDDASAEALDFKDWGDPGDRSQGEAGSPINRYFRTSLSQSEQMLWDGDPMVAQAVTISHGRILTIKQVWRADGYSLGDLRYSLPLAPLQKKNIAIIDWDRRDVLQMESSQTYGESFYNYVGRERDISEIVASALSESIKAHSDSSSGSDTSGSGFSLFGVAFGGSSGGSSNASTNASQDSSRTLASNYMNQLRDQTVQSANALRAQRVTMVQQVSQEESARAVTEVVANRNACHAITVQYFEVLRHFRVDHELDAVRECLYIPFPVSPFDAKKVVRWRNALERYLPSRLIGAVDACERLTDNHAPTTTYADEILTNLSAEIELILDFPMPSAPLEAVTPWQNWLAVSFSTSSPLPGLVEKLKQADSTARYELFEREIGPALAKKFVDELTVSAVLDNLAVEPLPIKAVLASSYRAGDAHSVRLQEYASIADRAIPRGRVASIKITSGATIASFDSAIVRGASVLFCTESIRSNVVVKPAANDLKAGPVSLLTPPQPHELRARTEDDTEAAMQLLRHLNENVEFYHKAIFWTMDPDRRYSLLDAYVAPNAGGRSVASVVENRLVGIIGNSLVMPVAPGIRLDSFEEKSDTGGNTENEGEDWLLAYYRPMIASPSARISVPTRGVFAESVMGSCNSCEKIDNSRNWQYWEHPLPDEPTAIDPLSLASRARDTALATPPQMPAAIINQVGFPPAPDASGTAPAIAAITNPNSFPNDTGIAGTQHNSLDALAQSYAVTKRFGELGAELAMKQLEAGQMAAAVATGNPAALAPMVKDSIRRDVESGLVDSDTARASVGSINDALTKAVMQDVAPGLMDNPIVSAAVHTAVSQGASVRLSRGDDQIDVGQSPLDVRSAAESRLRWPLSLFTSAPARTTPGPSPAVIAEQQKVAWGRCVSIAFKAKTIEIAEYIGINPSYLMSCMAFETGETFSPKIENAKGSHAVGLIQFTAIDAKDLKTTLAALKQMSDIEQLDYVRAHFKRFRGKLSSLDDVYLAILYPKAIGCEPDDVVFRKGTIQYVQNSGLDADKNGEITVREISAKVHAAYDRGMSKFHYG